MRQFLSTLILGGAVALASPTVFAAGHGHGGGGHHHGGHSGGGHNHGGHHHGGGNGHHHHGGNGGHHHHHHHSGYWPGYNVYRPNYGYGYGNSPFYGAYGIGSPFYRGNSGFNLYIGR